MTRSFTLRSVLPFVPEDAFDLSRSVDGHTKSFAQTGERAVAGVTSGLLGPGDRVTWRGRHFGVVFHLSSAITAYDRPERFVDEQVRGPFRAFRHEHRFSPTAGGTLVEDRVTLTAPFGPLGRLAESLVLSRYLARVIAERNKALAQLSAAEFRDLLGRVPTPVPAS